MRPRRRARSPGCFRACPRATARARVVKQGRRRQQGRNRKRRNLISPRRLRAAAPHPPANLGRRTPCVCTHEDAAWGGSRKRALDSRTHQRDFLGSIWNPGGVRRPGNNQAGRGYITHGGGGNQPSPPATLASQRSAQAPTDTLIPTPATQKDPGGPALARTKDRPLHLRC